MELKLEKATIHYVQYGKGKDVVLLHGWGQNIEMMQPIGDILSSNYRITILDFPGFGKSKEPDGAWSISDYAAVVEQLIQTLKIEKPIIMGHSFGGRVAICYSAFHPIEKLVLFASPCFKVYNSDNLKVRTLKALKRLPGMNRLGEYMKNYIGSRDYKAASPNMRQTFVNVVNEDLGNYARDIEEPTLIIWGEEDMEVTYEEEKMLEDALVDGALIVLPGTHYAYLENLPRVASILESFL